MSEVLSMTKLEAVNEMLYDLGERPVSSIDGSSRLDVTRAEATLDRLTREFCSRGWFFNREELTITPDGSGRYLVPSNIVKVDEVQRFGQPVGPVSAITGTAANFVVRVVSGTRLLINTVDQVSTGYTDARTFEVVRLLEFEQLPAIARAYLTAAASAVNYRRAIGASETVAQLQGEAAVLLAEIKSEEISQQDFDSKDSPRNFDLIWNR